MPSNSPPGNYIYSYPVYLIALRDCWGTRDDFPTIPFHLVLSSAALVELAKSIPLQSFSLPTSLSLSVFPSTVPSLKEIISQTNQYLVGLSSKTFVFEDKMTKYRSVWLIISFCDVESSLLSQKTLRCGQTTLVSVSWTRSGVRHFPMAAWIFLRK